MKANHQPKNTTFLMPGSGSLEIFWQTTNADHFLESYVSQTTNVKDRHHDVKFRDMRKILSGNVYFRKVPKSPNKHQAVSIFNNKYYQTIFAPERRTDCKQMVFAVIISCYICTDKQLINEYKAEFSN